MIGQASKELKISLVEVATAAGTSAIESAVVDMQGFENALFFTTIATKANDNIMTALQGTTSTPDETLTGSSCIALADADVIAIEVLEPEQRYLRVDIARGTSTAVGEIWCVQSRGVRSQPTSWADILTVVQSPAGT